ncbi:hypothetical protein Cob_v008211 [Colletotrichum orbiculare MAFF 240422]|uniref:Uncharacterized protein n=1 Tax=Colletotrichum orbiculare (strain 104-T / ATCC 96160 / CBS 514.97 / LARS 414 / MAFF 240422) TaxID=1213857 RepID=A0A484FJW9_COLOR|nr:hypothetical protein Cob_v008211 [Colletotrichum orbiculare MAFF 240422]
MSPCATSGATAFVESVLRSVLRQLSPAPGDGITAAECPINLETTSPLQRLRNALFSRLDELDRAFLIVDDIDSFSTAECLLLERELSLLSAQGLKVLMTSRIRYVKTVPSANFVEPYTQVELRLDDETLSLGQFISRDLELEHGDLGLQSTKEPKPPLSKLGRSLNDVPNKEAIEQLQERISQQADGNIALALLRLGNLHKLQSAEAALAPSADVLPSNIVAFFHAGIDNIKRQPAAERDMGLKVIAAVARCDFLAGIPYEVVHRVIRKSPKTSRTHLPARIQSAPAVPTTTRAETEDLVALSHSTHHSLEEMLYAARGFLVTGGSSRQPLRAYCEAFYTYVQEDYNEALAESRNHLDFGGVNPEELGNSGGPRKGGLERSQTGKVVGTAAGQV